MKPTRVATRAEKPSALVNHWTVARHEETACGSQDDDDGNEVE